MLGLIGIADNNNSSNFCSKVLLLFLVVFVFYFLPLLFHFTECLVIWMTHALGTKIYENENAVYQCVTRVYI